MTSPRYQLADSLLLRGYHPKRIALALSLDPPTHYKRCARHNLPTNREIPRNCRTARLIRRMARTQLWRPDELAVFYRQAEANIHDILRGFSNRRAFLAPPKHLLQPHGLGGAL